MTSMCSRVAKTNFKSFKNNFHARSNTSLVVNYVQMIQVRIPLKSAVVYVNCCLKQTNSGRD